MPRGGVKQGFHRFEDKRTGIENTAGIGHRNVLINPEGQLRAGRFNNVDQLLRGEPENLSRLKIAPVGGSEFSLVAEFRRSRQEKCAGVKPGLPYRRAGSMKLRS